jgi:hypothetical protein
VGGPRWRHGGSRSGSPRALDLLYHALAADTRSAALDGASDGLVAYKSAGFLVSTLAASLDRLVTRRALGRYLSALRARLAQQRGVRAMIVQRNRWLGWRVVPRTAVVRDQGRLGQRRAGEGRRRLRVVTGRSID